MTYCIETGESSFKHANGLDMYEYMRQNQQDAQIFNGAMTSRTSSQVSSISSMYDFSRFNTIMDIGGGQGMLLSTILKDNPKLQGIPHAIESARVYFEGFANSKDNNNDILSRCKLIDGDFLKSIPVVDADCYIIVNLEASRELEALDIFVKDIMKKFS